MPVESGASPFSAGALIANKYRLSALLGAGAMGAVWQAVNEITGGEVALKLIVRPEPELRSRLLNEAQVCCSIRHKNVVQVYDVGKTDCGDPFLVMQLLSGETLADVLVRKRRLSQEEAAAIGRDIARALAAAHGKGIVHRDLKPANVFLHNEPGETVPIVKVLDFGVSKNLFAPSGARTVAGARLGSPTYMSPEQARGAGSIDVRSDIWSLGIVLYEMLSGVKPFEGDTATVLQALLHAEVAPIGERVRRLDPALSQLVMACLRRAPGERPGPASRLADELDRLAGTRAPAPFQPPAAPPPDIVFPGHGAPTAPGVLSSYTERGTLRLSRDDLAPVLAGIAAREAPVRARASSGPPLAPGAPAPGPLVGARGLLSAVLGHPWTRMVMGHPLVAAGAVTLLAVLAMVVYAVRSNAGDSVDRSAGGHAASPPPAISAREPAAPATPSRR